MRGFGKALHRRGRTDVDEPMSSLPNSTRDEAASLTLDRLMGQDRRGDLGVLDLVGVVWRRLGLVVLVGALLLAPLLAVIAALPAVYTAQASLVIDPRDRFAVDVRPVLPATPLGDEAAIASEVEMLRSGDLLRRVVLDLKLAEQGPFAPEDEPDGPLEGLLAKLSPRGRGGDERPAPMALPTPGTLPSVVRAFDADAADLGALGLGAVELSRVVSEVAKRLDVWAVNDSRVIEVRFTAPDPALAAAVVNRLVGLYFQMQADARAAMADRTIGWLVGEMDELRAELEAAEREAEDFRSRAIAEVGADAELVRQQIREAGSAVLEAEAQEQRAIARQRAALAAFEAEGARGVLAVLDSPAMERFAEREGEADELLRELTARHGSNHPRLDRPREALEAIREQMRTEARSRLANLASEVRFANERVAGLEEELATLHRRLDEASRQDIRQRALNREVAAAQAVYETFVARAREVERIPVDVSPGWIVSTARPPAEPSSPNRTVLALAAFAFSGMIACAVALGLEVRSRGRLRIASEVRSELGTRCSGVIPLARRRGAWSSRARQVARWPLTRPRSDFSRAVRALARHALAASRDERGQLRPIVFTSLGKGDGKTTVARAVAYALATAKRVLVVTLDGGADDDGGAALVPDVLSAEGIVTAASPACEGASAVLHILDLGGRLSASSTAEELTDVFSAVLPRYDVVIVDGPEFASNVDFVLCAAEVARVLLLVDARRARKHAVADVQRTLRQGGTALWGVVLNRSASIRAGA